MSVNEHSPVAEYRIFGGQPGDADRAPAVVIADDQGLVRSGLRLILKAAGIDVVAEAANGEEAVAAVRSRGPDVVLMDVRMPVMDGIEATRRILADTPASPGETAGVPRVIMLTTFDLDEYVYAALSAGASGFLLKDVTPEHLVAAVQLVRTGDALLAPSITRRLVERFASVPGAGTAGTIADPGAAQDARGTPGTGARGAARPGTVTAGATLAGRPGSHVSALTPRELEVLSLVAHGLSNAEIAAEFVLSEATVKTHVARILTKLGLRDRVQAVVLAYETGLISPGS
jgi:DNA-binding NarL/FixJ family response regulator